MCDVASAFSAAKCATDIAFTCGISRSWNPPAVCTTPCSGVPSEIRASASAPSETSHARTCVTNRSDVSCASSPGLSRPTHPLRDAKTTRVAPCSMISMAVRSPRSRAAKIVLLCTHTSSSSVSCSSDATRSKPCDTMTTCMRSPGYSTRSERANPDAPPCAAPESALELPPSATRVP
eukprot:4912996-Prymnesium_polylepis.2